MTLGSSMPQPRDMAEVRNHLKWLDEERRKTARKITELEQRLAQQGRDLSEREQRIQDLEWQLGQAVERLERIPDMSAGSASQEQRLQDMEWHLSNINGQMVRLSKVEEELTRGREDRVRAIADLEQQVQSIRAQMLSSLDEQVAIITTRSDSRLAEMNARVEASIAELNSRYEQGLSSSLGGVQADVLAVRQELAGSLSDVQSEVSAVASRFDEETATLNARLATLPALEAQLTSIEESVDRLAIFDVAAYDTALLSLRKRLDAIPDFDAKLAAFQEATTAAMKEYEANSVAVIEEAQRNMADVAESYQLTETLDRITRLEESLSGLAAIRESVTQFSRMEQELELRQAEEIRLANLIGLQDEKIVPLISMAGVMKQSIQDMQARMDQSDQALEEVRGRAQELADVWRPRLEDTRRQIGPLADRLDGLYASLPKLETALDTLREDQRQLRDKLELLNDHVSTSQNQVTRQLDTWQATHDEQKDTMERFTQQWLTLSNQYKEARMAVQNFAHWQKQLEQQKKEASELVRIESNRMQSRWEGFLLEIQERFKNSEIDLGQKWQSFEMENEQRWAEVRRTEKQWRDELSAIDELILKMQQDNRNLIWRVQAAQADAIKKWPRMLLEEVEKAVEMNPQRRLQPTAAAAAGPRTEMSVIDALEQGLIKVDYDDKSAADAI